MMINFKLVLFLVGLAAGSASCHDIQVVEQMYLGVRSDIQDTNKILSKLEGDKDQFLSEHVYALLLNLSAEQRLEEFRVKDYRAVADIYPRKCTEAHKDKIEEICRRTRGAIMKTYCEHTLKNFETYCMKHPDRV